MPALDQPDSILWRGQFRSVAELGAMGLHLVEQIDEAAKEFVRARAVPRLCRLHPDDWDLVEVSQGEYVAHDFDEGCQPVLWLAAPTMKFLDFVIWQDRQVLVVADESVAFGRFVLSTQAQA